MSIKVISLGLLDHGGSIILRGMFWLKALEMTSSSVLEVKLIILIVRTILLNYKANQRTKTTEKRK